jgi:hypothetical protein
MKDVSLTIFSLRKWKRRIYVFLDYGGLGEYPTGLKTQGLWYPGFAPTGQEERL